MTAVRPETAAPALPGGADRTDAPVAVASVPEADLEAVTAALVRYPGARLADLFAAGPAGGSGGSPPRRAQFR
jgi:hypothetical protein